MRAIIDIFTRDYCDACSKAEAQVNASNPASHGVVVNTHDAGEDSSIKTVPLLVIGDTTVQGYVPDQIDAALMDLYNSLSPPVDTTPPDPTPPVDTPPVATPPSPAPPLPDVMDVVQTPSISPTVALVLAVVAGFFLGRALSRH